MSKYAIFAFFLIIIFHFEFHFSHIDIEGRIRGSSKIILLMRYSPCNVPQILPICGFKIIYISFVYIARRINEI